MPTSTHSRCGWAAHKCQQHTFHRYHHPVNVFRQWLVLLMQQFSDHLPHQYQASVHSLPLRVKTATHPEPTVKMSTVQSTSMVCDMLLKCHVYVTYYFAYCIIRPHCSSSAGCGLLLQMYCGLCVCWSQPWALQKPLHWSRCRLAYNSYMDSGGPKKRAIKCGPNLIRRRGFWGGAFYTPLWSTGIRNIWREPKLFCRLQQWCGLLLSVLQQLVIVKFIYSDFLHMAVSKVFKF